MSSNNPILNIRNTKADENLLYFYRSTCPFTKKAEPHINCLETTLNLKLTRLETTVSQNGDLYDSVGGEEYCGGVPFFYNKETGSTVCGARDCEILKKWANSTTKVHF